MKKLISFILSALMTLALLIPCVLAEEAPDISVSSETVAAGESAKLTVTLSGSTELAALKLEIAWDEDNLALGEVTDGAALAGGTLVKNTSLPGKLLIAWGAAQNVTGNGEIISFELTASENAKSGEYPVTLVVSLFADEEGNKTEPAVVNGVVTVSGKDNGSSSGGSYFGGGTASGGGLVTVPSAPSAEPAPPESEATRHNPFYDVAETDFYYDPVMWAVEKSITSGVTNTSFAPADSCTRAQTVTFLWRAAGEPKAQNTENPFSDVASGAYYYDAVLWAAEQGITSGTSSDKFSPDATVSRAETVTFLHRFAEKPVAEGENPFSDVPADVYYTDAVLWAIQQSITNGVSENSFAPDASCTRAQIVTFMYRQFNAQSE